MSDDLRAQNGFRPVVIKEGTSTYDIKLKNNENIFSVSTETSRAVALTKAGDSVEMKFIKVGDSKYIIINSFVNLPVENLVEKKGE